MKLNGVTVITQRLATLALKTSCAKIYISLRFSRNVLWKGNHALSKVNMSILWC